MQNDETLQNGSFVSTMVRTKEVDRRWKLQKKLKETERNTNPVLGVDAAINTLIKPEDDGKKDSPRYKKYKPKPIK